MPAPRILLLIPSHSYRARDFLAAAVDLGLEVVVGSEHRPVLADTLPGRSLTLDLDRPDTGVASILALAAHAPFSAVLASDDRGTELAAAAAAALGLPHNAAAAVAATRDKYRLRRALHAAGVPGPRFALVDLRAPPPAPPHPVRYPCVLKPRHLSAGRGVIRVDDDDAFASACRRIAAIVSSPAGPPAGPRTAGPVHEPAGGPAIPGGDGAHRAVTASALAEHFIPGREVVLEGLLSRGRLQVLALLDKPDPLNGPFFEETVLVTPSLLDAGERRAVVAMTRAAARAIGLEHGPLHAELRVNEGGARIIELAARPMGGLCGRSLAFRGGASLETVILRHALGWPVASERTAGAASGVMMIPIPRAGRLGAVHGAAAARRLPGIQDLVISIAPGEALVPLPEGDRYLGFIFARGPDPASVTRRLHRAHASLGFDIA